MDRKLSIKFAPVSVTCQANRRTDDGRPRDDSSTVDT